MKIKQICSKLLSLKKSDYIVLALMGILILIVAIPTGGADKKEKNDSEIAYEDQSRSENENYGKEVFNLRVFGELSYEKIGMLFGKSSGWARVTFYRAKKKIEEYMEGQKYE